MASCHYNKILNIFMASKWKNLSLLFMERDNKEERNGLIMFRVEDWKILAYYTIKSYLSLMQKILMSINPICLWSIYFRIKLSAAIPIAALPLLFCFCNSYWNFINVNREMRGCNSIIVVHKNRGYITLWELQWNWNIWNSVIIACKRFI